MNNHIAARNRKYRLQLMATVSAVVLLGASTKVVAQDADRPQVWIELGSQFERVEGGREDFAPAFFDSIVAGGFASPSEFESVLPWSYGAEGKISYWPANSDWVISAAVRFGRSHGRKSVHQQTMPQPFKQYIGTHFFGTVTADKPRFAQTNVSNNESHTILDFQVGKDVGIGMLGASSTSVFGAGIRYAQSGLRTQLEIDARPGYYQFHNAKYGVKNEHSYSATNDGSRSFSGLGPTVSWNASTRLAGDPQNSEIALDWGITAGLLFGRQKAKLQHRSSADYYCFALKYTQCPTGPGFTRNGNAAYSHSTENANLRRARSIVIPNLGGFAGLSLNWTNAKISFGYRADVFFGALDDGVDNAKRENVGFYGPFASVSIGLGK